METDGKQQNELLWFFSLINGAKFVGKPLWTTTQLLLRDIVTKLAKGNMCVHYYLTLCGLPLWKRAKLSHRM